MSKMQIFAQVTKIDEAERLVYGVISEEGIDKSGECMHYDSSKPHFEAWSQELSAATGGKSVGNVRLMHPDGLRAVGKLVELAFDDAKKRITGIAKIVDDEAWKLVMEGVLTGFSVGGNYVKRWVDQGIRWFTVKPYETSLVDNPCLASAHFEVVKADGITEVREFKRGGSPKRKGATMNLKKFGGPESASDEDVERLLAEKDTALEKAVTEKRAQADQVLDLKKQLSELRVASGETISLQAKVEELQKTISDREEKDQAARMKKVLDGATAAGKFKAADRPDWEKTFKSSGEAVTTRILAKMPAVVPIGERVGSGGEGEETTTERCEKIVQQIMKDQSVGYDVALTKAYAKNSKLFKQRDAEQLAKAASGGQEFGGGDSNEE